MNWTVHADGLSTLPVQPLTLCPKRRVPHADICSAPDHAPHHLPPRPAGKGKGKGKKTSSKKTSKTPSKTPRTSALPAGWEELSDDDTGATYFYNSLTEEVSISESLSKCEAASDGLC